MRLLDALLDTWKLRNFLSSIKNETTVNVYVDMYLRDFSWMRIQLSRCTYLREASALSVQLNKAMRRPPSVERATSIALAHFFIY